MCVEYGRLVPHPVACGFAKCGCWSHPDGWGESPSPTSKSSCCCDGSMFFDSVSFAASCCSKSCSGSRSSYLPPSCGCSLFADWEYSSPPPGRSLLIRCCTWFSLLVVTCSSVIITSVAPMGPGRRVCLLLALSTTRFLPPGATARRPSLPQAMRVLGCHDTFWWMAISWVRTSKISKGGSGQSSVWHTFNRAVPACPSE